MSSVSAQDLKRPEIRLWIRCGSDAIISNEIRLFHSLDSTRNVDAIKDKLLEGNQNEKLLSAIWLTYNLQRDSIFLTSKEKKAAAKIRRSDSEYELCAGCTFLEKGKIKELFSKRRRASFKLVIHALRSEL